MSFRSGSSVKIIKGVFRGVEGSIFGVNRKKYFDVYVSKPNPGSTGLWMVVNVPRSRLKGLIE